MDGKVGMLDISKDKHTEKKADVWDGGIQQNLKSFVKEKKEKKFISVL